MATKLATDHLLTALLPPDMADFIQAHVLDPSSPVQMIKRQATTQAYRAAEAVYPLLEPLVNRALGLAAENEGLVGLAVVVAAVAAVIVVMNWIRRLLLWWTRFVVRMAFWAVVVALCAVAWERGLARTARDCAVLGGKLAGYAAALKDVWLAEYHQYEAQRMGSAGAHGRHR
jgi:hypothetical protein